MLQSADGFVGSLIEMASKASMLLVPFHALFLRLLYWRPRRFYGEHLVFSLHVHAFTYAALSFAALAGALAPPGPFAAWFNLAVFAGCGVYLVASARAAYAEEVLRSGLKMAAVACGLGYAVALASVLALAFAGAFLET